jgi:hypothetical protein
MPERHELLTALTTEHFTLQGARAQAASQSPSRASLFVFSLASTLVALGFLGDDGGIFPTPEDVSPAWQNPRQ